MPKYSKNSQAELSTCHPLIQKVFDVVIQRFDHAVLCGHRPKSEQDRVFALGRSKVQWPNSKHNTKPSVAVDAVPYPIDWDNIKRFVYFGGFVMGVAFTLGVKLRWGGDWDGDTTLTDQNFNDYPHFELKETE